MYKVQFEGGTSVCASFTCFGALSKHALTFS